MRVPDDEDSHCCNPNIKANNLHMHGHGSLVSKKKVAQLVSCGCIGQLEK